MSQWLSELSFGQMICLILVVGMAVSGVIAAIRGGE